MTVKTAHLSKQFSAIVQLASALFNAQRCPKCARATTATHRALITYASHRQTIIMHVGWRMPRKSTMAINAQTNNNKLYFCAPLKQRQQQQLTSTTDIKLYCFITWLTIRDTSIKMKRRDTKSNYSRDLTCTNLKCRRFFVAVFLCWNGFGLLNYIFFLHCSRVVRLMVKYTIYFFLLGQKHKNTFFLEHTCSSLAQNNSIHIKINAVEPVWFFFCLYVSHRRTLALARFFSAMKIYNNNSTMNKCARFVFSSCSRIWMPRLWLCCSNVCACAWLDEIQLIRNGVLV